MAKIRKILAENIKKYRKKRGITQAELAEQAAISTNYIGMIEQLRKFPAPEMLDRIAAALEVDVTDLFSTSASPQTELKKLHRSILADLDRAIGNAVKTAIAENLR